MAIKTSELEGARRIDAEYYQPFNRNADVVLSRAKSSPIKNLASDIRYGISTEPNYLAEGTNFIRALNLREYGIEGDVLKVSPEVVPNADYLLKRGDILVVRSGVNVGDVGLIFDELVGSTFGSYTIRLRFKEVSPFFAYVFLKSKYGRVQTRKFRTGLAQPNINIPNLTAIKMPVAIPESGHRKIENLVLESHEKRKRSESSYAQAQSLLMAELGLDKLDLSESLYSVRRMSDLLKAKRADAEFYKPKYERLLKYIESTGESISLGNWIVEPIRRGAQPEYVDGGNILVVNSQHVNKTHIILNDNRYTNREFCESGTNKRALVRKYDVLLNSTGYITIGRCQTLLDDVKAIVDGHVSIIRTKDELDPVYLGVYLNSLAGQLQTERGWTGSSGQIELRIDVINKFLIWKAPRQIQKRIRQLVEESHQARTDAQRLLDQAKAEVERIIEGK